MTDSNQQSRPLHRALAALTAMGPKWYELVNEANADLRSLEEQYENLLTASSPMSDGAQRAMQALEIENAELKEQLEAARRVIAETGERVHLVLDDHYSGRQEERVAALPAYGWLTTVYEYEDENHDGRLRAVEDIILAVYGSNPARES